MKEWIEWRVENPIDLAGYQSQLAIGLALASEEAAFEKKLSNISVSTLILFGVHDKVVPPENAELLQKQIQERQTAIIPDAGHFFPIEVPDTASQIVINFLSKEVR